MNPLLIALKYFGLMAFVTGIAYPLLITLIAQVAMPYTANGSLLQKKGKVIGSELIGQKIEEQGYFWTRPSAIDYDPLKPSGGSNYGPTSQKLKDQLKERMGKRGDKAPADLLYASGSGLDPHISLEAAYYQIPRIAKARSLSEGDLKSLIDSFAQQKSYFSSVKYVNVLLLNLKLDEKHGR